MSMPERLHCGLSEDIEFLFPSRSKRSQVRGARGVDERRRTQAAR